MLITLGNYTNYLKIISIALKIILIALNCLIEHEEVSGFETVWCKLILHVVNKKRDSRPFRSSNEVGAKNNSRLLE